MNDEALKRLARNAKAWSEAYVRLVEELMQRGVPEADAREAATHAANHAALADWYGADESPWGGEL